jgi:(R,R)-butanediol dehydrogenase/meso-butanediol dehydrogenase/diacetyl reductase
MITETIGLDALPAMLEALRSNSSRTKVHVDPFAPASQAN